MGLVAWSTLNTLLVILAVVIVIVLIVRMSTRKPAGEGFGGGEPPEEASGPEE
jgi:hypothetical protein